MSILALVSGCRWDFVPDCEMESSNPATFRLRVLSAEEAARMATLGAPTFARDGSYRMASYGDELMHCLQCGLVGWSNVVDENNLPIPFVGVTDAGGVVVGATIADIDKIPHDIRIQLFIEIKEKSSISKKDFR